MKVSIAIGIVSLILASAGIAGAQTTAGNEVVVTGCVARAVTDGSVSGSPGVAPASPNDAPTLANASEPTGAFLLNNAVMPTAPRASSGNTTAPEPRSFQLDVVGADVEGHVGHQVAVTGTMRAASVGPPAGTKTRVDHIQVKSIRMLAAKCEPDAGTPK